MLVQELLLYEKLKHEHSFKSPVIIAMEKIMPLNKKILLVEDDMITAAAEAVMLRKNGFEVVTAPSGEKAIQVISTQNFDLVLMDIDLGHGINGSQAAEIILSTRMVPIIFLTSHSEKEIVEKVRSITRYGYVIKNSGDFVLLSSIEMAFELFNAHMKLEENNSELTVLNEELNVTNEELISTNEHLIEYQKNLEISEKKFRQLYQNMTEGVAIHELCFDNDGNAVDYRILSVNESFEKHTGIPVDKVKGKPASELYGTGTPPYLQEYTEVVKTGIPAAFNTYFDAMDKHFHIAAISIGKSLFATVFEDITERIKNNEKLKESERKYRNLYHYGHVGLFETSLKDATILACNKRYSDMAGFNSVEEAIGKDVLHLYADPEDREEVKRIMREQGYISDHIIKLKNQKTGNIFWGEFSARLNSELDVAEGTIIDITRLKNAQDELMFQNEKLSQLIQEKDAANEELQAAMEELETSNEELMAANNQLMENHQKLKQSEADLKDSEDRYKQLFDAESDAIFLIENETGYILEANTAAEDLYGFPHDDLIKMKNTDLSAEPEETQKVTHGTPVIVDNIVTIPLRYHKKKNGTVFPVEITGRFFQWHGKPVHIAAIRDITERKQTEDKIKSLLDEKEILLREVHHRIKNNMYTISNILFLQSESLTEKPAIDALSDARNRVQSMMLIYDKLYRSSDYKNISTKDYLTNLIDDITSIFPDNKRISMEKHIEDFTMNSNKLFNIGIIINEIITNSFKYAFPDNRQGYLKICAVKTDDSSGEITITDNGIGFKASPEITQSTGFGLELIKILADQIDAVIELNGEDGMLFKMKFQI